MSRLRLLLAVAPLLLAAPSTHAEFARPAACDADFAAMDASFEETMARLEKVTRTDKVEMCAAFRHHIEVMESAAEVFLRCLPDGHDQRENLGQVLGTAADFRDISINQDCPPLPDPKPLPEPAQ
jgi:hypothetical protein